MGVQAHIHSTHRVKRIVRGTKPNFKEEPFDSHLVWAGVTALFEGTLKRWQRDDEKETRAGGPAPGVRRGQESPRAFMGIICF
ncbi:hypothetical protein QQF64_021368 [Cirrhinus molitorella]|uniref:Uncharacterized protein n=1 Tax=Cirrhinus molitorella TaxID=172907 RepID=A0ABR3LBZ4_9TELE